MKTKAFKAALPYTLPICVGFLFLGMSYGFLMRSKGFSVGYPLFMSMFIFAGSMEFVTANLLLSAFSPVAAFFLALMVNARHLFYGLSMLEKYRGTGWARPFLIFSLTDETFSLVSTLEPPDGVTRRDFYFWISLLDYLYWQVGSVLGALIGGLLPFDTTGLDFALTALFIVLFLEQWRKRENRPAALIGLGCTAVSLAAVGADRLVIPAMVLILAVLLGGRNKLCD